MKQSGLENSFNFLRGGGEMGALTRAFDWSATPVGSPEHWPQSLRTTMSILLSSKAPMFLWWGEDLIQFYNDGYRPSLGENGKHPSALGQKGIDCWPEIWDTIHPLIHQVRTTGEPTWSENQLIPIYRNGSLEDVYWTFGYSAVMGESGNVEGVLVVCLETTESVKNLNKIQKSEKYFQNLVKEATVGIIVLRGEEMIVEIVNDAYSILIGRTCEELLGKPLFSIIPEVESEFRPILEKVRATNESIYEYGKPYTVYPDGEKLDGFLNIVYQPYKEEEGISSGIMVLCQEVTEQMQSRLKLAESEQRIRTLIESAPFPIGVYEGPDLRIALVNQALLNTWGRDRSVLGKRYRDVLPELKDQNIFEVLEGVFETGIPYEDKNRKIDLLVDGKPQTYYMNFNVTPLFDNLGKTTGIMSAGANVTQLNVALQKVEESEAKFRSLIEQAPIATCLFVGKEMKVELANKMMLSYWGKTDAVIGKPLAEALPELIGQPFLDILDNVYTTGIVYSTSSAEVALEVNGELGTYYFDFTYKPIRNASGDVYAIINVSIDVTTRVLAEQRVEENQRQLLALFEQAPVGVAILRKEKLAFTMGNQFYCELVGRPIDQLVGKPLLEAMPELNGQGFDKLLEEVIVSGIPYIADEVSVDLLRNGKMETRYVDLVYQPMKQIDESITGVFVVATDVTQQVRSRQKVETSEAKLRSIIASAPAGIGLFVGRDLIIEMPNQTFIEIVGKGPDIIGKPLREIMPELLTEDQPFLKILDDVFTSGKMYQSFGDQVKIVQNGKMTHNYYNITYSPLFDENGEVYAILDIAIDVTETLIARQKAEATEMALRGAVEMAELATWSLDIKNNTFSYSPRFMEWLGFAEDTKDMDDAYNPLPEDYRDAVAMAVAEAIEPGATGVYKNEHPIINRTTGQIRIITAHAQVFYDSEGKPDVLRGTAQDVTKERKLQQQLEYQVTKRTEQLQDANKELADANINLQKSNAELAQFAYIASHDLQEPARKISTFVKMLESSISDPNDRTKNYIGRINNSAERMIILIRDILGYSQLAKENETFSSCNLNHILQDILSDFELIIEQKQAKISYDELPVIEAIPLQMAQLFSNLVSNSLKYSAEDRNPKIRITTSQLSDREIKTHDLRPSETYYKLVFEDNGIGFNPEYATQIFNIFQRLHGKLEYAGTGIGLAMCKKIIENHHGFISASATEGKGALFTVILPAQQLR